METELERRSSKRSVDGLQRSGSDFSESAGRTGLTNYIGETNLDWEPPAEEPITKKERGISFRKALRTTSFRKKDEVRRPLTAHGAYCWKICTRNGPRRCNRNCPPLHGSMPAVGF